MRPLKIKMERLVRNLFLSVGVNDKPFNDVFNSLSTDDADKVSVDIIKETLNSIWKEKGHRVYEDPLEAFDTEMQS